MVVADDGFAGTVVEVATTGVRADHEGDDPTCGGVVVTVAAGEPWDAFVAHAVERGWVGVEALSGIPGSVGATPIQNVGAYGQEVSQTLASVRVWDRQAPAASAPSPPPTAASATAPAASRPTPGGTSSSRSTFQLRQGDLGAPVTYAELARALGVEPGTRAPMADVRRAVLDLRRAKGMVLDPDDHDTWSAGSFFTNPVSCRTTGCPRVRRRGRSPTGGSRPAPPG